MRRVLAIAGVGLALFAATACGTAKDGNSTAANASKPATDYTANTKDVCTQLNTLFSGAVNDADVQKAVQDAVKGKKTEAEIKAAALAATQQYMVTAFAKIKEVAAKADNPELKDALLKIEADLETAVGTLKSLDDDIDKKLSAYDDSPESKKVDELCNAAGVPVNQ
jgi:hypothetical protein